MKMKSQAEKIDPLFEFRQIPWLIELSAIKKKKSFLKKLKKLQAAIYDLDSYLEGNWKIKKKQLAKYWGQIHSCMEAFGLTAEEQKEWSKPIERYQAQELKLRDGISPVRLTLKHLYYYKSCDVKLMRRLIYREDPTLKHLLKPTDWLDFDLITEINDDVEDVFEDMDGINGNRFLFEVHTHGTAPASELFKAFVEECLTSNRRRFAGKPTKKRKAVYRWTKEVGAQTLALIDKRLGQKKINKLSRAEIFSMMK